MEPPIQAAALLQDDVACVKCHYNLRTRPMAGVCPECGAGIAESLKHHRRFAGAIGEPATLRLAAYCFGVPSVLAVAAFVGKFSFRQLAHGGTITQSDMLLEYGLHIVFIGAVLLGVILLGGSVTRVIASGVWRVMVVVLAGIYGVVNVFLSMGAIFALLLPRGGMFRLWVAMTAMQEQRIGTALLCLALSAYGWAIMRNLARALASRRLASLTRLVFGAMMATAAVTLVVLILAGAIIPRRDPDRFVPVFTVLDFASAVVYGLFGWYWFVVARMVKERMQEPAEVIATGEGGGATAEEKVAAFLTHRREGK